MLAADFLEANFDKVFSNYQKLLHSDNYVTRRQSLKLLGELLLDRHNFSVSLDGIFNTCKSHSLSATLYTKLGILNAILLLKVMVYTRAL